MGFLSQIFHIETGSSLVVVPQDMQVSHESDRRTKIEFEHGDHQVRATWTQPFSQSYTPNSIQDIIIASKAGDAFAAAELQYLIFNYKLSTNSQGYSS